MGKRKEWGGDKWQGSSGFYFQAAQCIFYPPPPRPPSLCKSCVLKSLTAYLSTFPSLPQSELVTISTMNQWSSPDDNNNKGSSEQGEEEEEEEEKEETQKKKRKRKTLSQSKPKQKKNTSFNGASLPSWFSDQHKVLPLPPASIHCL